MVFSGASALAPRWAKVIGAMALIVPRTSSPEGPSKNDTSGWLKGSAASADALNVASIRAECPICGDVRLRPGDLTVRLFGSDEAGTYGDDEPPRRAHQLGAGLHSALAGRPDKAVQKPEPQRVAQRIQPTGSDKGRHARPDRHRDFACRPQRAGNNRREQQRRTRSTAPAQCHAQREREEAGASDAVAPGRRGKKVACCHRRG